MLRRTPAGTYVIAKIKKENDEGTYVLLNGSGATPEGNIPFLDLFEMYVLQNSLVSLLSSKIFNGAIMV